MLLLRELNDLTCKDCFKNIIGTQQIFSITIIMLLLLYKIIIPRTVVRFGVRRMKTKGRVGIGKSDETDLSDLQAKTEIHGNTKLCLDKIKQMIINHYKKDHNAT